MRNEPKIYSFRVERVIYDTYTVKANSLEEGMEFLKKQDKDKKLELDEKGDIRVEVSNGADPETGEASDMQILLCKDFHRHFDAI